MQRFLMTPAFAALVLVACKPDLGPPASLIQGPRLLAIRSTPPEVRPGLEDGGVVYELLAVSPSGDVAHSQVSWSYCVAPNPPANNNLVSPACLGPNAQLSQIGTQDAIGVSPVPADGCSVFGPFPPARTDAGAGRPPDPDVTGGYYQPIRADLELPDSGYITTFGQERIQCGLPNVTIDVANGFKAYTLNQNPVLSGVTAAVGNGAPQALSGADGGSPFPVQAGITVTLAASWPVDSAESFPAFDQATRTLVTQRENLISSWFVTGGAMALDQVEVAGTDSATSASNQWTAPTTSGTVHLWVVLRDSRGGVDFGEFLLNVQ